MAENREEQPVAATALPRAGDHVVRCGQRGLMRHVWQSPSSTTVLIEVQGQLRFYRWPSEWELVEQKRRGS